MTATFPEQLRALAAQMESNADAHQESVSTERRRAAAALRAAADQLDAVSTVIEKAPHDVGCATPAESLLGAPRDPERPCTCWKADAL